MGGLRGQLLLQDIHLAEKLAHFNRERISERVVHVKGAGAYRYFEVTHDVSMHTKAIFLANIGKKLIFIFVFQQLLENQVLLMLKEILEDFQLNFIRKMATMTLLG